MLRGSVIIGNRCAACGHVQLESFAVCPVCLGHEQTRDDLGSDATLYSFSILHTGSASQGLGYADLPCGARTLVALEAPFDRYACDARVTLRQEADRIIASLGTSHA